jgi:hypothetical protein
MQNVILGVTDHESAGGSLLHLLDQLKQGGDVKVILTAASRKFVGEHIPGALIDEHEWHQWQRVRAVG